MDKDAPLDTARIHELLAMTRAGALAANARRDVLAAASDDLAAGFKGLGSEPWGCASASAYATDQQVPGTERGGVTHSVADIVEFEAKINLLSAADQLRGYAALLRAEVSLVGAIAVARGVFEATIWAAALTDSTLDPPVRLQRALSRRIARLSAGIRVNALLGVEDAPSDEGNLPPDEEIALIVSLAQERGWHVGKNQRAPEIGGRLSVDWLAENLHGGLGIESYAWVSGSSMSHGEHPEEEAGWVELSLSIGLAAAWLIRLKTPTALVGPRLCLSTLATYTGRPALQAEWASFDRAYTDVRLVGT